MALPIGHDKRKDEKPVNEILKEEEILDVLHAPRTDEQIIQDLKRHNKKDK